MPSYSLQVLLCAHQNKYMNAKYIPTSNPGGIKKNTL